MYRPNTEEVKEAWTCFMYEGGAEPESIADAQWDGDIRDAQFENWFAEEIRKAKRAAWEEGCLAGGNRKHHTNMTEEQAEKVWPNPYQEQQ